jgi:hypothetical protein
VVLTAIIILVIKKIKKLPLPSNPCKSVISQKKDVITDNV